VRLRVSVPPGSRYAVRHYRIDAGHSNIVPAWEQMSRGADWPDEDQWQVLRQLNTLEELCPPAQAAAADGFCDFAFDLPMPGVSYLELVPA
jgi:xylan 1,4-beta-xylosidase